MKYVTINGHVIAANNRGGAIMPPIRIAKSKRDKRPVYCYEADIVGPATLRYSPHEPIMACGARLVLECADAAPKEITCNQK